MVISELDEVLYWNSIDQIVNKTNALVKNYYPDNPDKYFLEKNKFYIETINSKINFYDRLSLYKTHGKPIWICGKNNNIDNISSEQIQKAYENSKMENGNLRTEHMMFAIDKWATHLDFYSDKVLRYPDNFVLELTIGAGIGTASIIQKMKCNDILIGVDIDFRCAKTADGIGKYHNVKALGICCNLWNIPFEDETFSVVCSHLGIDECREIPTIINETVRVLKPGGRIVFTCRDNGYIRHKEIFDLFSIKEKEAIECLYNTRLYSNLFYLDKIVNQYNLLKNDVKQFNNNCYVVEYIK